MLTWRGPSYSDRRAPAGFFPSDPWDAVALTTLFTPLPDSVRSYGDCKQKGLEAPRQERGPGPVRREGRSAQQEGSDKGGRPVDGLDREQGHARQARPPGGIEKPDRMVPRLPDGGRPEAARPRVSLDAALDQGGEGRGEGGQEEGRRRSGCGSSAGGQEEKVMINVQRV